MPKKPVTIYTTRACPHCVRAKALLKRKGINFREVDLTDNETERAEMEKKTGWMTVPMIFFGEEFIGGADELYELERTGKLGK